MSKYLSVKYLLILKKTSALAGAVQKLILGGSRGSRPKKFGGKKLLLQLNNFTQKLAFDFCGLGEEERTRFRKKKRKNKRKKLIAAKSGLVGIKGYLKTYV